MRFAGVVLLEAAACAAQGVITTIAGAEFVFPFQNGPALNAPLGGIWRIATDSSGNVYIPDTDNVRVFKYSPATSTISIFAGNGIAGRSGDDGPAVNASLSAPFGVAADRQGNVYITDSTAVRKVTPAGMITTVPVSGAPGFALFHDVAVDSVGNLYLGDSLNNKVFRIAPAGAVTVVAGNGTRGFSGDGGPATNAALEADQFALAVDSRDDLYIVANRRVRKVAMATGIITTVAGGGNTYTDGAQATSVQLRQPTDVALDAAGNMLIANPDLIYRVTTDGVIRIIADGGSGTLLEAVPALGQGGLITVLGIAADTDGNIYVADGTTNRVRRFTLGGTIRTVTGNGLFRFAGDGGPATSASFRWIRGLARGPDGSLYLSDLNNNRVRRIGPNGVISTYAGTGIPGFSGDGGLATQAQFFFPASLAADAAGNVYIADFNNGRIRKITPSGFISTIAGGGGNPFVDGAPATTVPIDGQIGAMSLDAAGNIYVLTRSAWIYKITAAGTISRIAGTGVPGFSGDGGPATAARIGEDFYGGIAVDEAGSVFFSDHQNHRVRRIGTNGIITTVAGNGSEASTGDGGPPEAAGIHFPSELRFDAAGNLLIAETSGHRVRRVSGGIITTIAGAEYGTSGDGGPATQAQLLAVWALLVEPDGSILVGDDSRRIRRIQASVPTLGAAPAALSFTGTAGGPAPESQSIAVSSSLAGLAWTASATSTGGNWLTLSTTRGTTPGASTVSVDPLGLAAGTYQGTITIAAPGATPGQVAVAVTLTVAAAQPAKLALDPATLTFQTLAGSSPAAQTVQVRNTGGGTLNWTATANDGGRGWLSLSRTSGTATPSAPAALQALVNAASLAAGAYHGTVTFTGSSAADAATIPVSLIVTAAQRNMLLSQTGLSFTAVQGDGVVPPQTFGVLNVGQGTMNWTASVQTAAGCGWLAVSPGSGSSVAGATDAPLVEVQVNAGRMDAGQYSCQVRVEAPDTTGSPRLVTVFLNILPPGSTAPALVRPTGLIFVRRAGTSSPGSQNSTLATSAPGGVDTRITASTFDPGNWLRTAENSLLVSPTQPGRLTVQPTLGSLQAGQYFGTVDVKFRDLASGRFTSQAIEVLFVVTPPGAVASYKNGRAGDGCVPTRLYPKLRTLGSATGIAVGYPSTLEVQVRDDCDNAVTNATVVASFSSGDPPLALVQIGNGVYTGSWRPIRAAATSIRVVAQAGPLTGSDSGNVQAASVGVVPAISPGGIVHGASFAKGGLAPGSIISVFGLGLAGAAAGAAAVPLPQSLAGSSLNIGGTGVPLYYASEGQVNAQVPYELPPGTPQAFLQVSRSGSAFVTDAETITVIPARPGIFAVGAPDGQGVVTDPAGRLVNAGAPAAAGDVVVIYASGLGATDRPVRTGEASPSDPPARAVAPVTVTVGGQPATVQFAGLTPGFVGLYQINVQIPSGVTPGSAVPLTVTQDGIASNTVTIGVR